ncbi:MAG: AhpC/TSA family protein [Luteolibacter sp.]
MTSTSHGVELGKVASEFRLNDGRSLEEASDQQPLVLVFMRHFGCTFTRQLLRGLEQLQKDAEKHGAQLVLIHMLKQGQESQYLGEDATVRSISDPKCQLYRAFGLGKGGLFELFGPRVWWLGMKAIFQGCGVGKLAGNGLQMPGAFVFHHGAIISAQRASTAADLPDLPRLFDGVHLPAP